MPPLRPAVLWCAALFLILTSAARVAAGVNYEEAPIHYSTARDDTAITRLQLRIDSDPSSLPFEKPHGYLKAVLRELDVPVSSQVLAFSKTSLQADRISPRTPRALYFNDEVHVGYVQNGILEIAAADPQLGMVFYTLEQAPAERPRFERQNNRCLTCHGSVRTRSVPGLLVRSVFPDPNGQPVVAAGSTVTTHSTPFDKRWGGWYVTGTHGAEKHLGNFLLPDARKPKVIENESGQNVTDLADRLDTSTYLSPHSDLVALMVLEHQSEGYNLMTEAAFEFQNARHREETANRGAAPADEIDGETRSQMEKSAARLVRHFLFAGETRLTAPIRGTSTFTHDFATRARTDAAGPSLREFDLEKRLFAVPCSYLIRSRRFAHLPDELRREVRRQIEEIVDSENSPVDFRHLTADDRRAIQDALSDGERRRAQQ